MANLIRGMVIVLVVEIGFCISPAYSQTPLATYQQTASLDGGATGYTQTDVTRPFSLSGPDSTASTDIETSPITLSNGVQTIDETAKSQVSLTGTATSPTSATTFSNYFVEVDSSTQQTFTLEVHGSVVGSVGADTGEAVATVLFDRSQIASFDILTGGSAVNTPFDQIFPSLNTNFAYDFKLMTSATVSSGSDTVSATIDPYVDLPPQPNLDQLTLKTFSAPVPEPTSALMLTGGLGLLFAARRLRMCDR